MNREAVIQGEGILNLIPQRPPIVMVDSFFGFEENRSYSGLTVTTDNLFCEAGRLQEPGIIEHIAQSAAARIGFIYTRQGEKVPLGFIGSVDKLKIYNLPEAGMKLFTEITPTAIQIYVCFSGCNMGMAQINRRSSERCANDD